MSNYLSRGTVVFGLIILLAVAGAVYASDVTRIGPTSVPKINPQADRYNDATEIPRHQPAFQKPSNLIQSIGSAEIVTPPPPFCDYIDYSGGAAAYFWTIPDDYGDDYFNMRFTSVNGFDCTLLTTSIGIYPQAFIGQPDMEVIVWDDDGFGYPGTELGRVLVPFASLPGSMAYVTVDLSLMNAGGPFTFTDGEEYHVGVTCPNQSPGVTQLAILSDDGSVGEMRSSEFWNGQWGFMIDDWGNDVNFLIGVDVCCAPIPFSECVRQSYDVGVEYYWTQPNSYGDDYYNMRMSAIHGADTLAGVGLTLYQPPTVGTPDLDIFVWGSLGGMPDLSNVIYQTTVAHADITWFPDYLHVDMMSENIIVNSDFHVGWSTNLASDPNGVLAGLSDGGQYGMGRSSFCLESTGCMWSSMYDVYGMDVNFQIYADVCADLYPDCSTEYDYCNLAYYWRLPDRYGDIGNYQKFSGGLTGCRLEKVRLALYDWGEPNSYSQNSEVQVYLANGPDGLPGTKVGGIVLTPADYVLFPGMTEVDFSSQAITFNGDIWVGIESFASDTLEGIATLSDDGSCGNRLSAENWNGSFAYMIDDWGLDLNFIMEAYICCEAAPPSPCGPGSDWPTAGGNFRRTSATNSSTEDARCKQTLLWTTNDPSGFIYSRPITYDNVLIVSYNDFLRGYDLTNGTILWTISGLPYIGTGFRNSVTASDGYVYFGGGNARSFSRADVNTGVVDWSRNVLNDPLVGNTIYTTSVILNGVVYFGTSAGELYAFDINTGLNYSGWSVNPVMVDGDILQTLSSNGIDQLYLGTDGIFGNGYGSLYAIDAASGGIIWTLGESDLLGHDIDNDGSYAVTTEIFQGPIGFDQNNNMLFVMSAFQNEIAGSPSGARYAISATDGSISWASPGRFPRYSGPVIDADNLVYFTALRGWTNEPTATDAVIKHSGAVYWQTGECVNALGWIEGVLDCQSPQPDLLYMGNTGAQFLVLNTDDGTVEFEYNYVANSSNRGVGIAIDIPHVVFTNRQGDIFVLTNQVDRPRLKILCNGCDRYAPVPFFSSENYIVTFEDVFMNNGCADLTYSLSASNEEPISITGVHPERIERMSKVADEMINNDYPSLTSKLEYMLRVDSDELNPEFAYSAYSKDSYSNTAAYAPPAWLNSIVNPSGVLAPGESADIIYDVNGPLVTRGPHVAYVTITTNDQYYLNSTIAPVCQLGVLGGCLQAEDVLIFGTSEQNLAPVHNTGEHGNQNSGNLFEFDGDNSMFWQGGLFFSAAPAGGDDFSAPFRMAWTTDSWHGADPPDFWNSLLPDPNKCGLCEPYMTPDPIIMARMSLDGGASYDDLYGYGAAYRYIDSVINFGCYGSGWDWANASCEFDNALTLGIAVDEQMYGVIGEARLNNVVIYRLDVENRNHPSPIDDIYVGAFEDFDLQANGYDAWKFDAAKSIAWGASCAGVDVSNTKVAGMGKIPMDVDPMIGVRTLDAQQAMWHNDNVALDSMYYWMTSQPGLTAQIGIDLNWPCDPNSESDDRDAWFSFTRLNFDANGLYSFGLYHFEEIDGDVNNDAAYGNLAILVNQLCGFSRGDINDDGAINLADVVALNNMLNGGNGPLFEHLADVNNDGNINIADVMYLANYYFDCTCTAPPPIGAWTLPVICP